MSVGEVIALLTRYATEYDTLLLRKEVYGIEVGDDIVDVIFSDANTADVRIFSDGTRILWKYLRED